MEHLSKAAQYTLQFINQTNKTVFLTGKAGTGKTTLLKEIIATSHKNTVVVAPTGIAALNAGGVTIHSMFQLPFRRLFRIIKLLIPILININSKLKVQLVSISG